VPFRKQVLTALGHADEAGVASVVLAGFGDLQTDLQPQAIDLLVQRVSWSRQLLRAVREGQVPVSALNANQVRQLLASKDPEIVEQVKSQWGTVRQERDPAREQVVTRMRSFLRAHHGDPVVGLRVFHKLCGQCHKIYGEGTDVGPDLTTAGRASYDQLLTKVFDPNQFLKAGYKVVTVHTTNGRSVAGLVVEDNSSRLVVKTRGGKVETIPRDDVEMAVTSNVSLMPEGIENLLTPAEIADLFAFLTLDRPPGDPRAHKIPGTPP
jgi:putative heme-binding domain-containing protein